MLKFDAFFRVTAAQRVRIALNLKALQFEVIPPHLLEAGARHLSKAYRDLSPAGAVPSLLDRDAAFSKSLAIIEYLDETYPYPPLLPGDPAARARVRAIALDAACEIHPLNNRRLPTHLTGKPGLPEDGNSAWVRHWIEVGLVAIEARLAMNPMTGRFCHGAQPTLADCCLVPQVSAARRLGCRLEHVPTVVRISAECLTLPAFAAAVRESAPDAQ